MRRSFWFPSAVELGALLLLLNGAAWGVALFNVAAPGLIGRSGPIKGGDFVHFYTLGWLAAEGRVDLLYDAEAQHREQERAIPGSGASWYLPVYGPQTALLIAPLARLPYLPGAAAWAALTALLYGVCLWVFWRGCPSLQGHKLLVLLSANGFGPFWALVHHGQTSVLPLLCVSGAWPAVRAKRPGWVGFALGSLVIKPQLGVAVAALALAWREWRVVGGALAAVALPWGVAAVVFGVAPFSANFRALLQAPDLAWRLEPHLHALHSLRGFCMLLCRQSAAALILYALSGLMVLVLTARVWRASSAPEVRYGALLLAIVFVAPHLAVYDLVVLAPAYLLTADAARRLPSRPRRILRVLLFLAYVLPWLGPAAGLTHLQLSVPVFIGWLATLLWAGPDRAPDGSAPTPARRTTTWGAPEATPGASRPPAVRAAARFLGEPAVHAGGEPDTAGARVGSGGAIRAC